MQTMMVRLRGRCSQTRRRGRHLSRRWASVADPEPWPAFVEAIKTRRKTGGSAEAAHRAACIMHLANISIRVGRKIKYDPVKEEIVGDEEANRLVNQPMRAPWHL